MPKRSTTATATLIFILLPVRPAEMLSCQCLRSIIDPTYEARAMGYNARNDEILDNVTRMRREWEAQSGALATVRGNPLWMY